MKVLNHSLLSAVVLLFCSLVTSSAGWAQAIVGDATLPVRTRVTPTSSVDFTITDGTKAGGNLFHSFSQFSIPSSGSAFFDTSQYSGIQNIISRVTGSSPSNIDGLLRANGTANVFLINPNGIIFGSNAQLNIGGSFLASTANSFRFSDGAEFSATSPQPTALLTISVPLPSAYANVTGLQYNTSAAEIWVQGATLAVPSGQTLALIGGRLTLDGATLTAANGRIELGGLVTPGLVSLSLDPKQVQVSLPHNIVEADLSLMDRTFVSTSSIDGGGAIHLMGRQITVQDSRVEADTFGAGQGGNLTLDGSETVAITGFNGDGTFLKGLFAETKGTGNAGDLTINTQNFIVQGEVRVSAATFDAGKGGNLTVNATRSVELTGIDPPTDSALGTLFTGLLTDAEGSGAAGNLIINTEQLTIQNGAQVSASTYGTGNGGNILVNATKSIALIGTTPSDSVSSGIFSVVQPLFTTGNSGSITVNTQRLVVREGAQIFAGTSGVGNGGNVTVNATDSVELAGVSPIASYPSGLFSAANPSTLGNAGDLTVNTERLIVRDGAQIATATFGIGRGGNLTINAVKSIQLSGVGLPKFYPDDPTKIVQDPSGLFSDIREPTNTNNSGSITVNTDRLSLQNGAQIAVSNAGTGNGGSISIQARSILLNNLNGLPDNPGGIKASTASGEGGNISLQSRDSLVMRHGSTISTDATGGSGRGGDIAISTGVLAAFENSDISANAKQGQGGNIQIATQGIFGTQFRQQNTPESDITASSTFGVSGAVQIRSPDVDPTRGVISLPVKITDVSQLIAQGCGSRRARSTNRFVITGRGGLPPTPEGTLGSEMILQDLETSPVQRRSNPREADITPATRSTSDPIVEAQGWIINAQNEVVLTAQALTPSLHNSWQASLNCPAD